MWGLFCSSSFFQVVEAAIFWLAMAAGNEAKVATWPDDEMAVQKPKLQTAVARKRDWLSMRTQKRANLRATVDSSIKGSCHILPSNQRLAV